VVTEPLDIVDVIVTGVGVADELAAGALALALLGTVALGVGAGEPELVPGTDAGGGGAGAVLGGADVLDEAALGLAEVEVALGLAEVEAELAPDVVVVPASVDAVVVAWPPVDV